MEGSDIKLMLISDGYFCSVVKGTEIQLHREVKKLKLKWKMCDLFTFEIDYFPVSLLSRVRVKDLGEVTLPELNDSQN